MKVLIITDWWSPEYVGGAERTLESTANYLIKNNYEVHVSTYKNDKLQKSLQIIKGVRVHRTRTFSFRNWKDKRLFSKIREGLRIYLDAFSPLLILLRVRRIKPDIILFGEIDRFGPYLILLSRIIFKKVPLVRSYHDFSDACIFRSKFRDGMNCNSICGICTIKNYSFKLVSRNYDAVVFVSNFLMNNLEISPTIKDGERFVGYPNIDSSESVLRGVQIPVTGALRLGIVSRLNLTKDLETVLHAIHASKRNIHLYILGIGDEGYVSKLKNLANLLELTVEFVGFKSNPYLYLIEKGVKCVVVPAIWQEAYGRVPIEAANFGLHSIVSSSGGLIESGKHITPESLFYHAADVGNLAEILKSYQTQDRVTYVEPKNNFNLVIFELVQRLVK